MGRRDEAKGWREDGLRREGGKNGGRRREVERKKGEGREKEEERKQSWGDGSGDGTKSGEKRRGRGEERVIGACLLGLWYSKEGVIVLRGGRSRGVG